MIDRFDINQTITWIDQARGELATDILGKGVLQTRDYPNPLELTLSGITLGGGYSSGPAYDEAGIRSIALAGGSFTIAAADPTNPRKDLVVIRYLPVEGTLIPKPSDPITTTYLNLLDGFEVLVRAGTPGVSPVYPATVAGDVVLGGILVPAAAAVGTDCTLDNAVREIAGVLGLAFSAEVPAGSIAPGQMLFTVSQDPFSADCIWLFIDGIQVSKDRWVLQNGNQILFNAGEEPQDVGQSIDVIFAYSTVGLTLGGGGGGGGGGGSTRYTVYGSEASPITSTGASPLAVTTDDRQLRYVKSNGGEVASVATPQVAAGSNEGQELVLTGTSDVDYMRYEDGNGLKLNGTLRLKAGQSIYLFWTTTVWREIARS